MTSYSPTVQSFGIALALLGASASCAVPTGTFHPLPTDHPASSAAAEGEIHDPGRVLAQALPLPIGMEPQARDEGVSTQVRYACPMHPDVVSDQPGECPRCGMALKQQAPNPAESAPHGH